MAKHLFQRPTPSLLSSQSMKQLSRFLRVQKRASSESGKMQSKSWKHQRCSGQKKLFHVRTSSEKCCRNKRPKLKTHQQCQSNHLCSCFLFQSLALCLRSSFHFFAERRNSRFEIMGQHAIFVYYVFGKVPAWCFVIPAIHAFVCQPLKNRVLLCVFNDR